MEIQEKLKIIIKKAVKALDIEVPDFALEYPTEAAHGDFATNVALILGKKVGKNPREIAEKIKNEIEKSKPDFVSKIEVAGPGFINFYLSREFFTDIVKEILKLGNTFGQNKNLKGKKILVEYTDPNPFKPFHIGHLMSNAIGESISRLFKYSGAKTINVNYQGDVGLHVAKAIYGMHKAGMPKNMSAPASVLAQYIGDAYMKGSDAYEKDSEAKKWIDDVNKKIYDRSDKEVNQVYDWGRKVTLEAFEEIYKILGTKFDYYFFESQIAEKGVKIVRDFLKKGVFEESEKAIVFKADKFDPKLHTRVFISSQGLPTYETKELGLNVTKFEKINPDVSIVVTANEQTEYMKVLFKAFEIMYPESRKKMEHISHGMMRFADGKMSSRKGNVITGESLIKDVEEMVRAKIAERGFTEKEAEKISQIVSVGAIKYSILRQAIVSDIIFDAEKSVSFEGDSGPYLQYAVVRAKSVIEKGKKEGVKISAKNPGENIAGFERKLSRFPHIVTRAADMRAPHILVSYLVDLASDFNAYYAQTKIIDISDPYSSYRLALASALATVVENGLLILGINVPDKM